MTCFYIFPTFAQARRVIWDSVTNDGRRFIDFIPPELIESKNSQTLSIRFKNGSLLQLLGSDNFDNLVGTNAKLMIFSEYALQDPRGYQYLSPILRANDGTAIFVSTPRGKNHFYDLYEFASEQPDWFVSRLTVEDTKAIPLSVIEKERSEGLISDDLIAQEYYVSFNMGVEGSIYGKYIDKLKVQGRICPVEWNPSYPVHTAWDLGYKDYTCITFFQLIQNNIYVIDYYDQNQAGLEHYIKIVKDKEYIYGTHLAPHDAMQSELGTGMTKVEKARRLGINFKVVPLLKREDGIEQVRSCFSRIWIDQDKCAHLIKALENYRYEYNSKLQRYSLNPLHNWASDPADAFRYMCTGLNLLQESTTAKDLDKRYMEAVYGTNSNMPAVFRDDLPRY